MYSLPSGRDRAGLFSAALRNSSLETSLSPICIFALVKKSSVNSGAFVRINPRNFLYSAFFAFNWRTSSK